MATCNARGSATWSSMRIVIFFRGGVYYPQRVREDEDLTLHAIAYPDMLRIEDVDGTRLWPTDDARCRKEL